MFRLHQCTGLAYLHLCCLYATESSFLVTFVLKILSAFVSAAYIQVHFRLDLIMEANTMNSEARFFLFVDLRDFLQV